MDQTTTCPTTATPDPARRRGLARVLMACSVLSVVLRPVVSAVLLRSAGDDFGVVVGGAFSDLLRIVSIVNTLLTLAGAALAVAAVILSATFLKQRGPGPGSWQETTGMTCVVVAALVVCLPFHVVVTEYEAIMALQTVTSAVAAVAALLGLMSVVLAVRSRGQLPGQTGRTPALLSTSLAAGSVLVLTVGSTGVFVPSGDAALSWIQPLVLIMATVMAVVSLVLAVRARRDGWAVSATEEPAAAPVTRATRAPRTETDRGLLAARLLGTPAAILLLVLSLVFSEFLVDLMLGAGLLAVTAIVAAVVEARRRTHGRRWLDAVGEVLVPGALLIIPIAMLLMSITDEYGWGVLAGLVWGGLLSIFVGLIGLVFTVVSVLGGRYQSPEGAVSALATALTFIPGAVTLSLIGAGNGAPAAAVIAGLLLLVGLIAGGIAVAQRRDRS